MTKTPILIEGLTDTSAYPERYNAFDIDTSVFDDADNGFYDYQITDQDGSVLEVGKMKLVGETVNPVEYQSTPIEYDTYGQ
ncbi:hypothetical protein [Chitinophaga sp. sic0106]|uniref:hypothetical protein n=1 Tax=Chitinophaga sp. sic0106 TaxID=2854785 RepID=UPI001C4706F1|nr:hypothetical protein [Chitinophaga sp. sic0106]MBV7534047.1 hypothetical protein [Chitinophaga sp. sic0106]